MNLFALLIGCLAAVAALTTRRELVSQLGRGWLIRYLVMQVGVINLALLAILSGLAPGLGLASGPGQLALPLIYGVLFFFYSVSNIDWTAKKFHSGQG